MRAAILTVSDRCAAGQLEDRAGSALREALTARGEEVVASAVVRDEREDIRAELMRWSDELAVDVVLTTGGTGLGPRDVTPEATESVLDRKAPGIAEAMRMRSLETVPTAMLSRGTAGVRGRTLIINLPGSPKGAEECFEVVWGVLEHAVDMMAGKGH
jgi:molybdenum cofactor synthesis domain-containing protein